jgi:hypothetical protein
MKNTFYLGAIVIFYWLIKEEIFDGGMKKICLVDLYRIPRSGSVQDEVYNWVPLLSPLICVGNLV